MNHSLVQLTVDMQGSSAAVLICVQAVAEQKFRSGRGGTSVMQPWQLSMCRRGSVTASGAEGCRFGSLLSQASA